MRFPRRSLPLSESARTTVLVVAVLLGLALGVLGVVWWLEEEQGRLSDSSGPPVPVPKLNRALLEEFARRLP